MTQYIYITFFAILIVSIICAIWLYIYKRRYTRERFAFTLSVSYLSAFTLVVYYILSPNYFTAIVNYFLTDILHQPQLRVEEPGLAEKALAIIALVLFYRYTNRLYRDWKGGKSVEETNYLHNGHDMPISVGIINFLSNANSRHLSRTKKNEVAADDITFDVMDAESIAWHEQVAKLLELTDAQYKINIERDWYGRENCYISKYGNNGQALAVFCSQKPVSDSKLSSFVKFVKSQKKPTDSILFIWAIQEVVDFDKKVVDNDIIEVTTEKKLLDKLVDFTDYKNYITKKCAEEQMNIGYPLTINDVYVEPTCKVRNIEEKTENDINSIEHYIADWLNDDSQHKQLALLGDYGQGKSVLSLRLAYMLLNGEIKSKRFPIIIELRGRYIKQYHDTKEILYPWAYKFGFSPAALLKLHQAGRLLLIFDGFDELDLIGDEQIRREHFRKLWEYSIPHSKIIITGRPNYFMNDKEMTTLLRLSQTRPEGSKYCETITLKPFSRKQVENALRSVEPSVRKEIINVYDSQPEGSSFRDLVSRPVQLFLTGLIWEKTNLVQKLSNINSAEVIRIFLNYSYKRQDERDTKSPKSIMNSDERAYFMQGIAIAMVQRHGYTNQINTKDLNSIIEILFQTFPDEITKQSGNAKPRLLKNRLDPHHLLQTIISDIRTCGVLIKDFSTDDTFCFAHKSFLEVLVADFISDFYLMRKDTANTIRNIKVMTIINAFGIKPDGLYLFNENIFNFMIDLMSAKINIEGEEQSKERTNSIYRQLHLYPLSLRKMGWIMRLFGPGFTSKDYVTFYIGYMVFISLYTSVLLLLTSTLKNIYQCIFASVAIPLTLTSILILSNLLLLNKRFMNVSTKRKTPLSTWSKFVANHQQIIRYFLSTFPGRRKKLSNLKIVLFFLVCKNLHSELALEKIWHSSVYRYVEQWAKNIVKDSSAA